MNTTNEKVAADQLAEAQAHIMHNVYAPAFFQKLASFGIRPENEQEAQDFLTLGFKLAREKQAEPENPRSKVAAAIEALDQLHNGSEYTQQRRYKAAGFQAAHDPSIYTATLLMKAAELEQAAAAA